MSSILTREGSETTGASAEETADGGLNRAFRVALEELDAGGPAGDRRVARTFVVMDVGEAIRYFLGRGGERAGITDGVEVVGSDIAETAAAELATSAEKDGEQASRGGSTLARLFLVGVVVGLGYALRRRGGSVEGVVDRATERIEATSGQAAERLQEGGERAAERIEETSEQAAERVEETGEQAAEQLDEAAETATELEEEAAEAVEEGAEEFEAETEESEAETEESEAETEESGETDEE